GEKVALKDHPVYAQYFKMLKVGLPKPAVQHKMMKDGVTADVLDKDPEELWPLDERKKKAAGAGGAGGKPKEKVRRKKLYWKEVEAAGDAEGGSVWQETAGLLGDGFEFDKQEFEQLFVSKVSPEEERRLQAKKKSKEKQDAEGKVLDSKRAMNAGIALGRVKMTYPQMVDGIRRLRSQLFTQAQLQSLPEFLPTAEEEGLLRRYTGDPAKLGEGEKFMLEMMKVPAAAKRYKAMVYKKTFLARRDELLDTVRVLEAACDDVKLSFKLKKLLGIILKLGNEMNQQEARGFSFDALLKLNQGKAFDQRTSILVYLIRLLQRNDPALLTFKEDLRHIFPASRVDLDAILAELGDLKKGLALVQEFKDDPLVQGSGPAEADAAAAESEPGRPSVTKRSLSEQKTQLVTQRDTGVTHFDKAVEPGKEEPDPGDPEESSPLPTFLFRAEYKVRRMEALIETVAGKFRSVVAYFGQGNQGPHEFFATLHSFCKVFDASLEQVSREDAARARKERQEKEKADRLAKKQAKAAAAEQAGKKPMSEGGRNAILEALRKTTGKSADTPPPPPLA
ncbi:unnamed protein product, partial [Heterosigma akashiwo]